jgi:hypothetical protein
MYLCLMCGNIYDPKLLPQFTESCPVHGCDGQVIEVDENLIPTIRTLNNKGYLTTYCCSGHPWGGVFDTGQAFAYVSFEPCIEKSELDPLPTGWYFDENTSDRVVIRAKYKNSDTTSLQVEILEGIARIAKWADGLKPREDEF